MELVVRAVPCWLGADPERLARLEAAHEAHQRALARLLTPDALERLRELEARVFVGQ